MVSDPDDPLTLALLQVAKGDRDAFESLYKLSSSRVFGICLRMLRDRGQAEEVLQDVYLAVWQRAETFDPGRAAALTWLSTLARHRAIDRLRQHRERLAEDDYLHNVPDEGPTPEAQTASSEERRRLENCLETLDAQKSSLVREAFYAGITYRELAERMALPLGTMKSWIRRSLIELKSCLEQ